MNALSGGATKEVVNLEKLTEIVETGPGQEKDRKLGRTNPKNLIINGASSLSNRNLRSYYP